MPSLSGHTTLSKMRAFRKRASQWHILILIGVCPVVMSSFQIPSSMKAEGIQKEEVPMAHINIYMCCWEVMLLNAHLPV